MVVLYVSVAYELLNMPDTPQLFDADPNIIDSVFRGLLGQRPGLIANQRQFDFCHRILEECLWGMASKGLGGTEEKGPDDYLTYSKRRREL
uniref:Uncharacterized protein n=1 Tax=Amphimedon queenslandica TaxID=400682 RepID=A0A1X7UZK8_AMPQE